MSTDKQTIAELIDGELPWQKVKEIISSPKDPERFDQVLEILQECVEWDEPILLPLAEHLYIVQKGEERLVKCDCGHEFGPYTENWKHKSMVSVRNTRESLKELYREYEHCDPDWMELREYFCPGCSTLLEVEALPPGYPVMFDFQPDLEGFYGKVLGRPLPSAADSK